MPAKVFISCGQAKAVERATAQAVQQWFIAQGYHAYVATEVQTLLDVNQNIIEELRTSDYYLFINFKREKLAGRRNAVRGSVYTQQELAVAYALDFTDMLVLNQRGTTKEGIHRYIISNTVDFNSPSEVLGAVRAAVARHTWNPTHSRKLHATTLTMSHTPILYQDHAGAGWVWIASVEIQNGRPDLSAVHCSARCIRAEPGGLSQNTGYLKVNGHIGYQQLIWPRERGRFDILNIAAANPPPTPMPVAWPPYPHTTIPTDQDFAPRQVLISTPGIYTVHYEVFADKFPRLTFQVELDVTAHNAPTARLI